MPERCSVESVCGQVCVYHHINYSAISTAATASSASLSFLELYNPRDHRPSQQKFPVSLQMSNWPRNFSGSS